MSTRKKKNSATGYKVSYSMLNHLGKWKRHLTIITYTAQQEAQRYADQLNRGNSTKNARVRKA
jgi:hypothetical protein